MSDNAAPNKTHQTQTERSEAMRKRLLQATLDCLAQHGYAKTSLSMIVRHAGVSRGAQVHHYPNKQALMSDAAAYLIHTTYRELGDVLLSIANEDDRLQALTDALWQHLFETNLFRAYCELLLASHNDAALAESLRKMLEKIFATFTPATTHYFESTPDADVTPMELFSQLGSLCVALAMHEHLMPNSSFVRSQFQLWIKQANRFMKPRRGVHSPPPRAIAQKLSGQKIR